jgi:outer membrane protein assembly factor BamB
MFLLLVLGLSPAVPCLALAAPGHSERDSDLRARFDEGMDLPPTVYHGTFDAPPLPHWKVRLPGGRVAAGTHTERARPVPIGEHLLVGSAAGQALYMLSRRDGSLVRTFSAAGSVESEPTVAGDRVYFTDTAGYTWSYRLDGELVWKHKGGAPILVRPTVHQDRVYVTNVDDLAVALNAEDGSLLWRYRRPPDLTRAGELALYAAPPAVVLGEEVLLGFSDGFVVALDADEGEVAWERRVGEGRYPDLVAAPVPHQSDIFAAGYFTPFVAIDRATHNIRWRLELGAASAPAIDATAEEAILYLAGTDGALHAVASVTGAELWTWDSQTPGALTTPLITPAGLLVGSSDGQVYLVNPADGRELWRYHEPVLLDGVTSAPAIDGRQLLFISNAGWLHSMVVPRHPPERPTPPYPSRHP